jgi:hypothetical protein
VIVSLRDVFNFTKNGINSQLKRKLRNSPADQQVICKQEFPRAKMFGVELRELKESRKWCRYFLIWAGDRN